MYVDFVRSLIWKTMFTTSAKAQTSSFLTKSRMFQGKLLENYFHGRQELEELFNLLALEAH